jgi:hypothetical protein
MLILCRWIYILILYTGRSSLVFRIFCLHVSTLIFVLIVIWKADRLCPIIDFITSTLHFFRIWLYSSSFYFSLTGLTVTLCIWHSKMFVLTLTDDLCCVWFIQPTLCWVWCLEIGASFTDLNPNEWALYLITEIKSHLRNRVLNKNRMTDNVQKSVIRYRHMRDWMYSSTILGLGTRWWVGDY